MGATAYIERSWLRHIRCKHPFFAEANFKRNRNGLDLSDLVRNESGECDGNFESHLPELQKEHLKPMEKFVGNSLLRERNIRFYLLHALLLLIKFRVYLMLHKQNYLGI